MSKAKTARVLSVPQTTSWWSDFQLLVKFKLTTLVVLTSVLAYFVAVGFDINLITLVLLGLGGFLVTGAANALNQVIEKEFDAEMERTKDRPIAAGRMTISQGVIIAGVSLIAGTVMLTAIHPLAGLLGMLSVVMYAFVYTPMKRFTTLAVPVGAVPGAMPVLIGYVAGSGELTSLAITLFAIQFLWQFPHFWSVAYLSHDDYMKAGFKFLHAEQDGSPDRQLGLYSFIYAVILLVVAIGSALAGYTGWLGGLLLIGISAYYAWKSWLFYRSFDRISARKLMFSSFSYILIALICFLLNGVV